MGLRQEVETLFFGSGVQELYEHWQTQFRRFGKWPQGDAPDVWAYRITVMDPLNSADLLEKVITYSVIRDAAERIAVESIDTDEPFHPLSPTTDRACSTWIYGTGEDLSGFDPHTIDETLQVAVYGGVLHPHFESR
jgi:hypothetical protein